MRSREEIERKLVQLERALPSEEACLAKPELGVRRTLLRGAIEALRWCLESRDPLAELPKERWFELLVEEVKRRGQDPSQERSREREEGSRP